jgi:ureidoacrylate peracid hydrolase
MTGWRDFTEGLQMHEFSFPQDILERILARRERIHPYTKIDPRRTALVVIDMQNAFMAPGAPTEIPAARDIVPNVNRLAHALRTAGGTVAWIQMTLNAHDEWPTYLDFVLGPKQSRVLIASLAAGTEGHELWAGLEPSPSDLVLHKNRFSAFLPGACPLPGLLREQGIDTVIVVGTLTTVCCGSSARDAVMLDFKTIMVADANATRSDQEHASELVAFIQSFGDVRTTDDVIELIDKEA